MPDFAAVKIALPLPVTPRATCTGNWLALGLLLAAWNCADDAARPPKPGCLRGYVMVSVRAWQRTSGVAG